MNELTLPPSAGVPAIPHVEQYQDWLDGWRKQARFDRTIKSRFLIPLPARAEVCEEAAVWLDTRPTEDLARVAAVKILAAYPSAKPPMLEGYLQAVVEELGELPAGAIVPVIRDVRREIKFLPSVAEIIEVARRHVDNMRSVIDAVDEMHEAEVMAKRQAERAAREALELARRLAEQAEIERSKAAKFEAHLARIRDEHSAGEIDRGWYDRTLAFLSLVGWKLAADWVEAFERGDAGAVRAGRLAHRLDDAVERLSAQELHSLLVWHGRVDDDGRWWHLVNTRKPSTRPNRLHWWCDQRIVELVRFEMREF